MGLGVSELLTSSDMITESTGLRRCWLAKEKPGPNKYELQRKRVIHTRSPVVGTINDALTVRSTNKRNVGAIDKMSITGKRRLSASI